MVINKKTMLLAIILSSSACIHGSEEKDEKLSSSAAVKIEATDRENSRKKEVADKAKKNIRKVFFENNIEEKKSLAQEHEKIIDDLRVHREMLKHFADRESEAKDTLERIQQELENPSDVFVEKRYENQLKRLEVLGKIRTISNLKEDFRRKRLYLGEEQEMLESFADKKKKAIEKVEEVLVQQLHKDHLNQAVAIMKIAKAIKKVDAIEDQKEAFIQSRAKERAKAEAVRRFNFVKEAPNVRVAKKAAAAEKIQAVYRRKKAVKLFEELPFREEK